MKTIWILGTGASKANNSEIPAQELGIINHSNNNFPLFKKSY